MKHDLSIVRGTTNAFGVALTDADGKPFALENGQALVFGLKYAPECEDRIWVKKITHAVDGEYYLELEPSDTADLRPGRYYYDVGLQQGNSVFYNVIETSVLIIKPNVTRLGDGA